MKYQPFHMHFDLEVKYSTSQKYLADRKKKEVIIVLKSNSTAGYNLLQGCPSSDLLYGLEKGNHKGEMLLLNLLFFRFISHFSSVHVLLGK